MADIMAVATDVAMATIGVMTGEVLVTTVVMMVAVTRGVAPGTILAMTVAAIAAGDMAIIVAMTVVVMRDAVILVLAVGDNAPSMGCQPIADGDMAWLSRQSSWSYPPIAAGAMPAAIAATRPLLAIAVTLAIGATVGSAAIKL
jgi:hypothetical protein